MLSIHSHSASQDVAYIDGKRILAKIMERERRKRIEIISSDL